jgi:glycosyltransferase involved in cell wall biosynthesis
MRISAVILAHNEMHTVGDIVKCCKRHCDEVIVVDDGSTDETSQVSSAAGAEVVRNIENLGLVRSTEIGLRAARGDVIVTLDADGQHDPAYIPILARPIIEDLADMVLGKRDRPPPISERAIARLISFRVKCGDVGTGYRAFRGDLAHRIRLWGFCLCGSLVLEANKHGARILEVPIRVGPRRLSKSHWSSSSRMRIHSKQAALLLCQLLRRRGLAVPRNGRAGSLDREKSYIYSPPE